MSTPADDNAGDDAIETSPDVGSPSTAKKKKKKHKGPDIESRKNLYYSMDKKSPQTEQSSDMTPPPVDSNVDLSQKKKHKKGTGPDVETKKNLYYAMDRSPKQELAPVIPPRASKGPDIETSTNLNTEPEPDSNDMQRTLLSPPPRRLERSSSAGSYLTIWPEKIMKQETLTISPRTLYLACSGVRDADESNESGETLKNKSASELHLRDIGRGIRIKETLQQANRLNKSALALRRYLKLLSLKDRYMELLKNQNKVLRKENEELWQTRTQFRASEYPYKACKDYPTGANSDYVYFSSVFREHPLFMPEYMLGDCDSILFVQVGVGLDDVFFAGRQ